MWAWLNQVKALKRRVLPSPGLKKETASCARATWQATECWKQPPADNRPECVDHSSTAMRNWILPTTMWAWERPSFPERDTSRPTSCSKTCASLSSRHSGAIPRLLTHWDNKCMQFEVAKFVITCYTTMENEYICSAPCLNSWHTKSVHIMKSVWGCLFTQQ